jgi:hypothetical protein
MNATDNEPDYAVRLFLHKRFIRRPGIDRVGRPFREIPADDGRCESACAAQSLFVDRLIRKYANPSDDVYAVETDTHKRELVRMEWLRLYWQEVSL